MKKLRKIWLILISLTIIAFLIGWLKLTSSVVIAVLFITTFIKGHLVIEYFMGLNEVEGKYRFIPTIWLGLILCAIALGYYL